MVKNALGSEISDEILGQSAPYSFFWPAAVELWKMLFPDTLSAAGPILLLTIKHIRIYLVVMSMISANFIRGT
jgi:hypothetical protein